MDDKAEAEESRKRRELLRKEINKAGGLFEYVKGKARSGKTAWIRLEILVGPSSEDDEEAEYSLQLIVNGEELDNVSLYEGEGAEDILTALCNVGDPLAN